MKSFQVFMPNSEDICLRYVADFVDVVVDNIEASQAIVFVVTEAMLQYEWCDFVFQYVAAREYTNLVFIMCEPIRDQAWHTMQEPLRNVISTSKNVITWPRDSKKKDSFWKELRLSLPAKLGKTRPPQSQSDTPLSGSSHGLLYVWIPDALKILFDVE